jgi:hypothetical protein
VSGCRSSSVPLQPADDGGQDKHARVVPVSLRQAKHAAKHLLIVPLRSGTSRTSTSSAASSSTPTIHGQPPRRRSDRERRTHACSRRQCDALGGRSCPQRSVLQAGRASACLCAAMSPSRLIQRAGARGPAASSALSPPLAVCVKPALHAVAFRYCRALSLCSAAHSRRRDCMLGVNGPLWW